MSEPSIADGIEQSEPEVEDFGLEADLEHRARAEAERALADLAADDGRERVSAPPDVREERVDVLVGVGNELLEDHLEPGVPRPAPGLRGLVGVVRDDGLVPEAERVLLALRGLQEKGGLEIRRANRLLGLGEERRGRGNACFGGGDREQVLAPEAKDGLGVRRQGDVGERRHLVPVAEDELDVLVPFRHEHRTPAFGETAQIAEQPAIAGGLVVLGREAAAAEVARPEAELVAVEDASVHRDPRASETACKRQPGREKAEHEHGPKARSVSVGGRRQRRPLCGPSERRLPGGATA